MYVDAFLADSVATAGNKLYVHGGAWNILRARTFPARQARIALAIAITVPYTETGTEHRFVVQLEDADGNRLQLGPDRGELAGNFDVRRSPEIADGDEQIVPLGINLDGLVFERPGRYRFLVTIDGQVMTHMPFQVVPQASA